MTASVLNLTSAAKKSTETVTLGDQDYQIKKHWNIRMQAWIYTICTGDGTPIARSPVVTNFSLFSRYPLDELPTGRILAVSTSANIERAGQEDLGARIITMWEGAE